MKAREKEAIRYLGYGKTKVDEQTLQLIRESFEQLEAISRPDCIWRILELQAFGNGELQIGNMKVQSSHLEKNLKGCSQVILFGTTLGTAVDRQIHTCEIVDIARAVVLQACAAAFLEEYCDEMQGRIAEKMAKEQLYLRPRFSPGYGDFSIMHQRQILQMLDAAKKIGLTMTESYMLTPTKSVTAVIGVSETKGVWNVER